MADQDVSELLRRSNARLQQLFDVTPVGMLVVDAGGRIAMANPAVANLFGYSGPDALIGQPVEVLVEPAQRVAHTRLRSEFGHEPGLRLMAGRPVTGRRRDGSTVPLEVSLTPLADTSSDVLAIVNDLRSRLQASDAIRAHSELLDRHNRDLEQFAHVVAHDLREPLRMVASFLQLLERDYAPALAAGAREYIDYAVAGARRMQALLEALSRYARYNQAFRAETIELAVPLADAMDNLAMATAEAGALIEAEPLPAVLADPSHMVALFQNLISNAMRYRGEAPPRVHIRAAPATNGWVQITVADNGIGIEPRFQERAFQIFQRLQPDMGEGTGIGLTICKRIVEMHGGRISLAPGPEGGTLVHFTLPLAISRPAAEAPG